MSGQQPTTYRTPDFQLKKTANDAIRLNRAELSHRVCLHRYTATSYPVKFFLVDLAA
jgi:hypothetical protein